MLTTHECWNIPVPDAHLIREDRDGASVTSIEDAKPAVTLDQLTHDHHDFLLALARKLCRSNLDPADLVQETLMRTVARFDRLPAGVNHRAWMTQVMKNLFTDQLRRARTRARVDLESSPVPPETDELPWWHALDSDDVRAALAELPSELRETFDRFAFRGESYEDIARALGIPKPTVGTRILRARRRIKELLVERSNRR
jgi:RNA polymerase sigma-70 factor (ECF subfamily)